MPPGLNMTHRLSGVLTEYCPASEGTLVHRTLPKTKGKGHTSGCLPAYLASFSTYSNGCVGRFLSAGLHRTVKWEVSVQPRFVLPLYIVYNTKLNVYSYKPSLNFSFTSGLLVLSLQKTKAKASYDVDSAMSRMETTDQ